LTATLDDLDDPLHSTSDRAPLTGRIAPGSNTQDYLTSSIPGEDRRAPTNTIDETVWETLSRDLIAIWSKMQQVLYPKYLLGGMMQRGGGMAAAERGEADSGGSGIRGLAGRWPDADVLLQGGMSEGLRDWDLWGPLIFCLLLSLFLSRGAKDSQKDLVFSGIFAMVWIGEAVVTLQIKLLGGNMCVDTTTTGCIVQDVLTGTQSLLPVHLHHRLHAVPTRHCRAAQCRGHPDDCPDPRVPGADCVVVGSRRQHHGRVGRGEEPGGDCSVSSACLLHCAGLHLLHQLGGLAWCVCLDSDLDIMRVGRVRRVRDAQSGNAMVVFVTLLRALCCFVPAITIGCAL
jgi:hypothetical protein